MNRGQLIDRILELQKKDMYTIKELDKYKKEVLEDICNDLESEKSKR